MLQLRLNSKQVAAVYTADGSLNHSRTITVCVFSIVGLQHAGPKPVKVTPVYPPCCTKVSKASVRDTVDACFLQKEETFAHCKIRAYV